MTNETDADRRQVTDAGRLRALAHPLRVRLFHLVAEHEQLTATQCAELVGESPANCSFHLRTLAKHGFIERAEGHGREKPWRRVAASWDMRPEPADEASALAAQSLALLTIDHAVAVSRASFERLAAEADEWTQASTVTGSRFWATAEELAELSRELQAITDRFEGRSADPSKRPEGARPARLLALAHPDLEESE